MSFIMKPCTETIHFIYSGRSKVGSVVLRNGSWMGKIGEHTATAATARAAFLDVVRICNRVALCGENDAAKARAALAENNAAVRAEAAAINDLLSISGPLRASVAFRKRKIAI